MANKGKVKYEFSTKMWKAAENGGWHFCTLPKKISTEIRENFQWQEEGWGRLRIHAKIGKLEWQTAIWFDTKLDRYLLPLKADIRKNAGFVVGHKKDIVIWI